MEFPYIEFEALPLPSSRRVVRLFRPMIPLTLLYGRRFAHMAAVLIDSGADYNIFHGDVAVYLGISITGGAKRIISGIGGKIRGYEHKLQIKI